MFVDNIGMNQFVNPQATDIRYGCPQLDYTFTNLHASSGYSKSSTSRAESGCRRPSLTISDTRSSDSSSFESSAGCLTPCTPVSATSTSSSRRQSMITPGNQQYYLSPSSPSPMSRSPRSKQVANTDHYSLQQHFTPKPSVVYSNVTAFMTNNGPPYCLEDHFPMTLSEYPNNAPNGMPCHQASDDFMSGCEQSIHANSSTSLTTDMVRDFSFAVGGGPAKDFAQPYVDGSPTQIYDIGVSSIEAGLPQMIDPVDVIRSLEAPFEYESGKIESETELMQDDAFSSTPTAGGSRCRKTVIRSNKKRRHTRTSTTPEQSRSFSDPACKRDAKYRRGERKPKIPYQTFNSSAKKHVCPECFLKFVRPEHLARHKKSIHDEENTKYYPCAVHDCKDPKTGDHKMIKARGDNMAPHYNNTHFSWGNSDKSGKNRRISLKESLEIGLVDWDNRWVRFLEGGINMDGNPKGEWKMLGYSIRETQEKRVKDIISSSRILSQQWEGPENATLKDIDYRWQMLLDGAMDYETAMAVGYKMKEFECRDRGLLGVTMMESEEMGLKKADPRWQKLLSGKMTVDDSEILGVKHLNPAWLSLQAKRRR